MTLAQMNPGFKVHPGFKVQFTSKLQLCPYFCRCTPIKAVVTPKIVGKLQATKQKAAAPRQDNCISMSRVELMPSRVKSSMQHGDNQSVDRKITEDSSSAPARGRATDTLRIPTGTTSDLPLSLSSLSTSLWADEVRLVSSLWADKDKSHFFSRLRFGRTKSFLFPCTWQTRTSLAFS